MKLKIKNGKIKKIDENTILKESNLVDDLGGIAKDVTKSLGILGKNIVSNVKFVTLLTASAFYNIFSESGSWENFRKRMTDLNNDFNRETDAHYKEMEELNRKLMRDAGIKDVDMFVVMAAANPAIAVIDLMSKHKMSLTKAGLPRTIGQFVKLGERYEKVIYKKLYCYYKNVKPSEYKPIAISSSDTSMIVNKIRDSKTFGRSATDFFNTITISGDKSNQVRVLYRRLSSHIENIENKEKVNHKQVKSVFISFFNTLKESIIIKKNIILEKSSFEGTKDTITDEYIAQVDKVLTAVTAVLIDENDNEFRALFLPGTIEKSKRYEADLSIIATKYFHIENISHSAKKQLAKVSAKKSFQSEHNFETFINAYEENLNLFKSKVDEETRKMAEAFFNKTKEALEEVGETNSLEFVVIISELLKENLQWLQDDDIISVESVESYIQKIKSEESELGIKMLTDKTNIYISLIEKSINKSFERIKTVQAEADAIIKNISDYLEELEAKKKEKEAKKKEKETKKKEEDADKTN